MTHADTRGTALPRPRGSQEAPDPPRLHPTLYKHELTRILLTPRLRCTSSVTYVTENSTYVLLCVCGGPSALLGVHPYSLCHTCHGGLDDNFLFLINWLISTMFFVVFFFNSKLQVATSVCSMLFCGLFFSNGKLQVATSQCPTGNGEPIA